jgi:hypothetical protein
MLPAPHADKPNSDACNPCLAGVVTAVRILFVFSLTVVATILIRTE